MSNTTDFSLSYANIPFVLDQAFIMRLTPETESHLTGRVDPRHILQRKQQPEGTLLEEIDRIYPLDDMEDFTPSPNFPGRSLSAVARTWQRSPSTSHRHSIGQFYYPNMASRWSVFRYLATSAQARAMYQATTGGKNAADFIMKAVPLGIPVNATEADYTITTSMYMLPPRTIAEHSSGVDGLYLITLVDERYKWQFQSIPELKITQDTQWSDLIDQVADELGISLSYTAIPAVYLQPEIDSQLWSYCENAPQLLDALAFNVDCIVVRSFDGSYKLMTYPESAVQIATNKEGLLPTNSSDYNNYARTAGGDMLQSGSNLTIMPSSGSLNDNKNAVCPATITVSFPKYVIGNDPVPHIINSRYQNQRPSCWYEDGVGNVFSVTTPILSGGPYVSGITGVSTFDMRSTSKALISSETQTTPLNTSGLIALARQISQDYWEQQSMSALDETYPGTYAWEPEGFNDIIWTYSADKRQATTRVQRCEWNMTVREFQHSTPTISGLEGIPYTNTPIGVGGPSVAQTWRDSYALAPSTFATGMSGSVLSSGIMSGDESAYFAASDRFPTMNRWRATISSGQSDQEIVEFERTSGLNRVYFANRGIDGSVQQWHTSGSVIQHNVPDTAYGVNLVSAEKMQWVFPGAWTSGGISEAVIVPQTQTVFCLAGAGTLSGSPAGINTIDHWSGYVQTYNTALTSGNQFPSAELCWLVERNGIPLLSGKRYDGQFVSPGSLSGRVAPVYAVNEDDCCRSKITVKDSYDIFAGYTSWLLTTDISGGSTSITVDNVNYLPVQNRWKGTIDSETILFNGTSGLTSLSVVQRGEDGTAAAVHLAGTPVIWKLPDTILQADQLTFNDGFFTFQGTSVSGVILCKSGNEAIVLCPTRSVQILASSGQELNSLQHWSGRVLDYNPSLGSGSQFTNAELCWVTERNGLPLVSGKRYDGQLVAAGSVSGTIQTIYAVGDARGPEVWTVATVTLSSNQNNYSIPYWVSWLRINATADITITGFALGIDGRVIKITNIGTGTITLPNDSSSSSSANRMYTPSGQTEYLYPNNEMVMNYEGPINSKWYLLKSCCYGGVYEFDTSTFALDGSYNGKIVVFTGSGTTSITGDATLPQGFRCSIRNKGAQPLSLIEYARASGGVDPIPPYRAYELSTPAPEDTAVAHYADTGMSLFGVRTWSGTSETVSRADCARELVFTGSADTTLTLLTPDSDDSLFAVAVRNLSTNNKVTIARGGSATIDGQTSLVLKPCEGVILHCNGTNWYAVRGRMCAGVIETSSASVTIGPQHHGKVLVYTGTATCTITGDGSLPAGFRCGIRNKGAGEASLILYTRAAGGVDPIPPYRAYNLYVPDTGDTATLTYADTGMSLFGVRTFSSSVNLTRADCARQVTYTGTGNTLTLFQPDSDDFLFACQPQNYGTGDLTLGRNGRQINGAAADFILKPGVGCWLFSDGTNWWVCKYSPLTTKGDLYTYSTGDDRLPVGTTGYVLRAESGVPTGLQWAGFFGGNNTTAVSNSGVISFSKTNELTSYNGSTSHSFTTIATWTNPAGLSIVSCILNAGANSMVWRLSTSTTLGLSEDIDFTIATSGLAQMTSVGATSGANFPPPWSSVAFKIKSAVSGSDTLYFQDVTRF